MKTERERRNALKNAVAWRCPRCANEYLIRSTKSGQKGICNRCRLDLAGQAKVTRRVEPEPADDSDALRLQRELEIPNPIVVQHYSEPTPAPRKSRDVRLVGIDASFWHLTLLIVKLTPAVFVCGLLTLIGWMYILTWFERWMRGY